MASPSPLQALDLRNQTTHQIRLGRSVIHEGASSPSVQYAAVQYNHKPTISHAETSTLLLLPPKSGNAGSTNGNGGDGLNRLQLKDGEDRYEYSGPQRREEHTYILIPEDNGKSYTLEKVDSTFLFNLSRAPWESDARILAQNYAQVLANDGHEEDGELSEGEEGGEGHDDGGQSSEPESDNPFDFRHYLNTTECFAGAESPMTHPVNTRLGSTLGTPLAVPLSRTASKAATPTPLARALRKPTSAFGSKSSKAKSKSNLQEEGKKEQTKRIKTSPEAEPVKKTQTQGKARSMAADKSVPSVRLDGRAITGTAKQGKHKKMNERERESDDGDDTGDLILEGDSGSKYSPPWKGGRSLGLALGGQLGLAGGQGPRSLRSAASSPASRVNSPHPASMTRHDERHGNDMDLERELELELDQGSSPEREPSPETGELELEAEHDDDVGGSDGDVDEMRLPSPAQTHKPSISETVVTAAVDDDDDLENAMLAALEGDEGAESEESEEE